MPNMQGNAYALTALCPLVPATGRDESPAALIRDRLNDLPTDQDSPFARVPNTYFVRLFVLDDVVYQSKPAVLEHLASKYLVFSADFHGALEPYLLGLWQHAESAVQRIWEYCLGFSEVRDAASFMQYMRKCQVTTTFYFNGSNGEPLADQLKALYLKQEFGRFVCEHQGLRAAELQAAFRKFVARTKPASSGAPTWRAGAADLENVVVGEA
jgi:hypothetical protein